jgi:molybdopterin-containing oxidoreductase family iron-sulfur binding subunit
MSKRIFQHPEPSTSGRKYWRSLGQLNDTPEFRGLAGA